MPTGQAATFDAAPLEESTTAPFGPSKFLVGALGAGSFSVTIGAVNTIFLGMEQDVVSYSDSPITSVQVTTVIANPAIPPIPPFLHVTTTDTAAQWLAANPTQVLLGQVDATVDRTVSNIATQSAAQIAFGTVQNALSTVEQERAKLGAYESRFHFSSDVLAASVQNDSAAASVLNDVDVAATKAHISSTAVRLEAAVAALSQATLLPKELLKLIQS